MRKAMDKPRVTTRARKLPKIREEAGWPDLYVQDYGFLGHNPMIARLAMETTSPSMADSHRLMRLSAQYIAHALEGRQMISRHAWHTSPPCGASSCTLLVGVGVRQTQHLICASSSGSQAMLDDPQLWQTGYAPTI